MPIRPEMRHLYPPNWKEIRASILERAGNLCEGSPRYPDCRAANGEPHPVTGSKVGSSGHQPRPDVLEALLKKNAARLQFKFVVGDSVDLAEALALLASLPLVAAQGVPVILQPVGSPGDSREASLGALETLARQVVGSPEWAPYQVRILPQLHRLLCGERRGS